LIARIFTINDYLQNAARLEFQQVKKQTTQNISQIDWTNESDEAKREAQFYYSWGSDLTTEQLEQVQSIGPQKFAQDLSGSKKST
jgi:DNA polymerase/3'-5' exonuclease PolX